MAAKIDIRAVESPNAAEIYISATPGEGTTPENQAQEIFSGIHDILQSKKAHILQERIFATPGVMDIISSARAKAYGNLDDGVAPSLLLAKEGLSGPIAGVQVYAITADNRPEVIRIDEKLCGRAINTTGCKYLTLSGLSIPQAANNTDQAKTMMQKAESVLRQFEAGFLSVPRTWMWLKDILSWYDDFNHVRTQFFTENKLIGDGTRQSMPASTGIGLGPADGCDCAMDLTAVLEPKNSIKFLQAIGKQQCAMEYGSAFSRASEAITPAGKTVFVSGTASIDADGITTNIGDASGQIATTIDNVRAVLSDMNCKDEDV
ncbi:MAG: hypothetical protein PVH77_12790, partial [Phycisphaerales bacterium]